METLKAGGMNLKFRSHNREHSVNLKESPQQLKDVPINLLGMSQDEQKILLNKLQVSTLRVFLLF